MKRFGRALIYSVYLMSIIVITAFVWNTFQNGLEQTTENLIARLDTIFLYLGLLTVVFWVTYEVRFRGGLDK